MAAEIAGPVQCCPQLSATGQQPGHSSELAGLATQSGISEETECYVPVLVFGDVFLMSVMFRLLPGGLFFNLPLKAAPCRWSEVLSAPVCHPGTAANLLEALSAEALAGWKEGRSAGTDLACS